MGISRTYNSLDLSNVSELGTGWQFNFDSNISESTYTNQGTTYEVSTVKFLTGDTYKFDSTDGKLTFSSIETRSTLSKSGDYYTLTTIDQYKYKYLYYAPSKEYRLVQIIDTNGNCITIARDVNNNNRIQMITDSVGRNYIFSYDEYSINITDPSGNIIGYVLQDGDIFLVEDGDTLTNVYCHNYIDNYVTDVYDGKGIEIEKISYIGTSGSVKASTLTSQSGEKVTYLYGDISNGIFRTEIQKIYYDSSHTLKTDSMYVWCNNAYKNVEYEQYWDGTVTAYGFNNNDDRIWLEVNQELNYANKNDFDTTSNETTTTYDRGVNSTTGNILTITDPNGLTHHKIYDPDKKYRLNEEYDQRGTEISSKVFYIYCDGTDNIEKIVRPFDGKSNFVDGQSEVNFAVTSYTYEPNSLFNGNGLIKTITDPQGNITTNNYNYTDLNYKGRIWDYSIQNYTTTYTYDANGRLTKEIAPPRDAQHEGIETTYDYNTRGDLLRVTKAGTVIDRIVYDSNGQKVQEIGRRQYSSIADGLNTTPSPTDTYVTSAAGTRYTYVTPTPSSLVHT